MTTINIGGIASWILFAILGIGILWAANEGYILSEYSLADNTIPMDTLGLGILLIAVGLGVLYFLMDISNKV